MMCALEPNFRQFFGRRECSSGKTSHPKQPNESTRSYETWTEVKCSCVGDQNVVVIGRDFGRYETSLTEQDLPTPTDTVLR